MLRSQLTYAFVLTSALASGSADACMKVDKLDLSDIKYASAIVIGRVSNYKIIRDIHFREKMLSKANLPPDLRKIYESENRTILSDYAQFDVEIDETLVGKAAGKISVTWDNSTFGEPREMVTGPFLIALRNPTSGTLPIRGPSATILPTQEPGTLTVLQAPCSIPFIFDSSSDEARKIRNVLGIPPR